MTICLLHPLGCAPIPVAGSAAALEAAEQERGPLWAGCAIAECYAEGEVRHFLLSHEGKSLAESWGRYVGLVQRGQSYLHLFESRFESRTGALSQEGEARSGAATIRAELRVWFDDAGRVVEAEELSATARQRYTRVAEGLALERDDGLPPRPGAARRVVAYPEGAAVMGYMALIFEELMLATRSLPEGHNSWDLLSLSDPRAETWSGDVSRLDSTRDSLLVQTSLGELIEFRRGRIEKLSIPEDNLRIAAQPSGSTWPSWQLRGPSRLRYQVADSAGFRIRDLEIPAGFGQGSLGGEVLVPSAAKPGGHPGVLMLSGSVPVDRYGFAGPPAIDVGSHEISDRLAEAGFVVLRFDDRGRGASAEGTPSWLADIEDARRAYAGLLLQPEVDPGRIIIVGHGEGGWRALKLAQERPRDIRGVALLATPARPYSEILAASPALLRAVESGMGALEGLGESVVWYREILHEDPERLVKSAPCPLWIASAGKDFEVQSPEAGRSLYAAALQRTKTIVMPVESAGFEAQTLVEFSGLDHHFKPESGASGPASYQRVRAVDQEFLGQLTAWARVAAGISTAEP